MGVFSFRITTNGVLRNYRSNLMKNRSRLEVTSERVMTHRSFNSYAEDPTAASRAFQIRRAAWRTDDALNNTNYAIGVYQTAWSDLGAITDGSMEHPGFDGIKASLQLLNDPTGSGRWPLGQSLKSEAESIVQVMNGQYAGNFIFAGADGHKVPFVWGKDESGNAVLTYRGVNVNTPDPGDPTKPEDPGGFLGDCLKDHKAQVDALMELETLPTEFEARTERETQVGTDPDGKPLMNKTVIERELTGSTLSERTTVTGPDGTVLSDFTVKTTITTTTGATGASSTKLVEWYNNEEDPNTAARTEKTETTLVKTPATANAMEATTVSRTVKVTVDGGAPSTEPPIENTVLSAKDIFEKKSGFDYETALKDYPKLQKMNDETTYIDIGLGLEEDPNTGAVVPTSAFNTALSGIKFLGYGVDEDGDPKNMAVLMRELGELALRCDENTGAYASNEDAERANVLTRKLRDALSRVQANHVELDAQAKLLKNNADLLVVTRDQQNEQLSSIEQIDPALAIEEMSWANYCYQAALKIGNGLLSQSLIDYMT